MVMNATELRAAGDWVVQLKKILQQGPSTQRVAGNHPEQEHRSTKKAVKLMLSNMRKGAAIARDQDTSEQDLKKVVFNAVDLLLDDKVAKSKQGKTRLEALNKFQAVLNQEFNSQSTKKDALDNDWKTRLDEAFQAMRWEQKQANYTQGDEKNLSPQELQERENFRQEVLTTDAGSKAMELDPKFGSEILCSVDQTWLNQTLQGRDKLVASLQTLYRADTATDAAKTLVAKRMRTTKDGRQAMVANPDFGAALLCDLEEQSPGSLKKIDFGAEYGDDKGPMAGETLVTHVNRITKANQFLEKDKRLTLDRELFTKLKSAVDLDTWNDTGPGNLALGPRACQSLWGLNCFDEIVDLINLGVDTSVAARVNDEKGAGVYSGFVQPIQHVVAGCLRDISLLKDKGSEWEKSTNSAENQRKPRAEGAQKIFAAMEKRALGKKKGKEVGAPVSLTKWDDVKKSEMVAEFAKNPGTIWGFESIRMPFVSAAHETQKGAQPLRMMEIWDAVKPTFPPDAYEKFLADPDGTADKIIKQATIKVPEGVPDDKADDFKQAFARDAKTFLIEFAKQMPKGAFASNFLDVSGNAVDNKSGPGKVRVADVTGVGYDKFMNSFACKAGLWWAKENKKPVYYCLDGINMDDVTNYKKVKNKAIEEFLASGGVQESAKGHDEVVTMVEVREILKNWDDLKDTVKFVHKGKMLKGQDLQDKLTEWQDKLKKANQQAGRAKAPPKGTFTHALNALNPKLLDKIPDTEEGDKDARDIAKKSGYLVKVASTRPKIVLKYIVTKCQVLIDYDLISAGLPAAAAAFAQAKDNEADEKKRPLLREIKKCHADFRTPLQSALLATR